MALKWTELFEGLQKDIIPFDGTGYILAAHFDPYSQYTRIETIAFKNLKKFEPNENGITFYSDGFKIYIMYEPATYQFRFQEPYLRQDGESIPLRFSELEKIELPNHAKVFISREPNMSFGSFNIERPSTGNFVYFFYDDNGSAGPNLNVFLTKVLQDDLRVPRTILTQILSVFNENLKKFQRETEND